MHRCFVGSQEGRLGLSESPFPPIEDLSPMKQLSMSLRELVSRLTWTVFLLFWAFLFIGGANYTFRDLQDVISIGSQSNSWPSVETRGIVAGEPSHLRPEHYFNSKLRIYGVVHYHYRVGSKTYGGERVRAVDDGFVVILSGFHRAKRFSEYWASKESLQVFYNPSNPSQSVIIPGIPVAAVIERVAALLFLLVGAVAAVLGLVSELRRGVPRTADVTHPKSLQDEFPEAVARPLSSTEDQLEFLEGLAPELRPILDQELAQGNSIYEVSVGWPKTDSVFVFLDKPFTSRLSPLPIGVTYSEPLGPHNAGAEYEHDQSGDTIACPRH